jgi:hypothetical protein
MRTMEPPKQNGTQFVQGTMRKEGQRAEPQNRSHSRSADLAAETDYDALIREVLEENEREGTVQDRLAGYMSQSEGE